MEEVEFAIQFIDAHDRQIWISVGFGLKSEFGESAWELFDRWSSTASNYNAEVARSQWKSFKQGKGITIKTVFHLAREAGWRPDKKYIPPTPEQLETRRMEAEARLTQEGKLIAQAQSKAAQKARFILNQCELDLFAYMDSKGFGKVAVNVWRREDKDPVMVIPMSIGRTLTGCQIISKDGKKTFLKGQFNAGATFDISNRGKQIYLTEGFASGLSLQAILSTLKLPYTIKCTFSAGNMKRLAEEYPTAILICDNDISMTGQNVGIESGCKWWCPEQSGWDVNDLHQSQGLFKTSQIIRKFLHDSRKSV